MKRAARVLSLALYLALSGCEHTRHPTPDLDAAFVEIDDSGTDLASILNAFVCLRGRIAVEPHSVHFPLKRLHPSAIYGDRIILPFRYADVTRQGLRSGDVATFCGVLREMNLEQNSFVLEPRDR